MTASPATIGDAQAATLALLAARDEGATVCPSEVARALAGGTPEHDDDGWRGRMPLVHAAVDDLLAQGSIRLSWKGKPLATRGGPYRIARGQRP